jgi:predicted transposase/invertase (TIGR01784 family)
LDVGADIREIPFTVASVCRFLKPRKAWYNKMLKGSGFCLLLRINTIPYFSAVHKNNWVMSVFSCWRCGKPVYIFCGNAFQNLLKYGHYAFRVAETYCKDTLPKVTIVVIYTADVEAAPEVLDLGSVQLQLKQVFLTKFNSADIYHDLQGKVAAGQKLSDEDIMRFIVMPLTQKNDKQVLIEKTVELAKEITDELAQKFIIAGLLAATDKFIDKNYAERIRRRLEMTKVGQIFEEEKLEYAQKSVQQNSREIARKMFSNGVDILTIMDCTLLSKAELLKIKEELPADKN